MRLAHILCAIALSGLPCIAPATCFSTGLAPRYIVDAGRENGPAMWLPDKADVARAETALRIMLSGKDDSHLIWQVPKVDEQGRENIASDIDNYTLQFVGARRGPGNRFYDFQGTGPRVIAIFGFCNRSFAGDLSQHLAIVFDGGDCYFRAVYDPSVDAIIFFGVNGVA